MIPSSPNDAPDSAVDPDKEWQFVTDDQWSDPATAERMYDLADRMASMAAGNASLKFYGPKPEERVLGMETLSFCGPVEVAVRFDALDGMAVWAWRMRPLRCEGCGIQVDEDNHRTDVEGVVLCDPCFFEDSETVDA